MKSTPVTKKLDTSTIDRKRRYAAIPSSIGTLVFCGVVATVSLPVLSRHTQSYETRIMQAERVLTAKKEWQKQKLFEIDKKLVRCSIGGDIAECSHQVQQERENTKEEVAHAEAVTNAIRGDKTSAEVLWGLISGVLALFAIVVDPIISNFIHRASFRTKKYEEAPQPTGENS